jgi:hypothetical protein
MRDRHKEIDHAMECMRKRIVYFMFFGHHTRLTMKRAHAMTLCWLNVGLFLLLVLAGAGCDTVSGSMDAGAPEAPGRATARLVDELSLDERQLESLEPALRALESRTPGALWLTAARLQETLNLEQKKRLFARSAAREEAGPRGRFGPPRDSSVLASLSEDQRARLRGAMEAHRDSMRVLFRLKRDGLLDEATFRRREEELLARTDSALSALLPPEARERLAAGRIRRGGRPAGVPENDIRRRGSRDSMPQAMIDALGLTEDQQARWKALHEAHRAEWEAWRASVGDGAREEHRAALDTMRERHRAALDEILTDSQRETVAIFRALWVGAPGRRGR